LELMNPSIGDLMLSKIEEDTMGAKAKKKIARRRDDFIDGNAKSYANTKLSYTNEKAGGLQQDASLFGRDLCRKRRRKEAKAIGEGTTKNRLGRRGKQARRQHWQQKERTRIVEDI